MKTGALLGAALLSSVGLLACGSTQTAGQTRTTSAALTAESSSSQKAAPSEAEKWAEQKVNEEAQKEKAKSAGVSQKGGDPLGMSGSDAMEESNIPKVEMTPAREVRGKSRADLDAAMKLLANEASVDGAAKKLTVRLGKPSWTENGAKRVWIAAAGAQCHRLVLEADGTVEVETAAKSDWRMITGTARMNPCTGEIKRGIDGGK